MSDLTRTITGNLIETALHRGFTACRRHYAAFLLTGVPAAFILLMTSVCEYLIRNAGVMTVKQSMSNINGFAIMVFVIRLLTYGALISSWSWLAGEALFDGKPSIREAIGRGISGSFRSIMALLPVWIFMVLIAQITSGICKVAWILFSAVNTGTGLAAVLTAATAAIPLLLILSAKFMFVIPVSSFEKVTSFEALAVANSHVHWRSFVWAGTTLSWLSMLILAGLLVPSLTYITTIWGIQQPLHSAVRQAGAVVATLVIAPLPLAYLTALYFAHELAAAGNE